MFIIQLKYKTSLEVVEQHLIAHRQFLDIYYKKGLLIASGPLEPRVGGIIIALSSNRAALEAIFAQDPFYVEKIAEYTFTEFIPVKYCDALKGLLLKDEI